MIYEVFIPIIESIKEKLSKVKFLNKIFGRKQEKITLDLTKQNRSVLFMGKDGNKYLLKAPVSISEQDFTVVYQTIFDGIKHGVPIEMIGATAIIILHQKGIDDVQGFYVEQTTRYIKVQVM